jgi:hypothetical protein
LRGLATRCEATLNDLLLRDLLVTVLEWNTRHRGGRPGRWLRIGLPQNLRPPRESHMPAASMMSYAFITRRSRDCLDPEALLASIRWETAVIKRWNLGLYFLGGVAFARRIPGALALSTAGRTCFATTVLTNLGDASRRFTAHFPRRAGRILVGDLVLENLIGIPPVRPKTHAVFSAFGYNGGLTLSVRCDPHVFHADDARRLLAQYVAQVERTTQAEVPAIPPSAR